MLNPVANALQAFLVVYQALPGPFRSFITYTLIASFVIALLWMVVRQ